MNSICFTFILCLLSVIVVIESNYRHGYRPRLAYNKYDDDYDGDNDNEHDYRSHYPRHYLQRYPRIRTRINYRRYRPGYIPVNKPIMSNIDIYEDDKNDHDYPIHYTRNYHRRLPTINAGNRRRGPKGRQLTLGTNLTIGVHECLQPPPVEEVLRHYVHPRNPNCVATYKEGQIYCNQSIYAEPRKFTSYYGGEVDNPLYSGICENATPITTQRCYTPPALEPHQLTQVQNSEIRLSYQHPTHMDCVVDYRSGGVTCHGKAEELMKRNRHGEVEVNPIYRLLCSYVCAAVYRYGLRCNSTNPIELGEEDWEIANPGCYMPNATEIVTKIYEHPYHFNNASCVVTFKEGNVYCFGRYDRGLPPDPKVLLRYYGPDDYKEEDNPVYFNICKNVPARTKNSCYTPPGPSLGVSNYQHPTDKNCYVSYTNGSVYCNGTFISPTEIANKPLYLELCSMYCPELLPFTCTSTRPKSCRVCESSYDFIV